MPLDWKTSDWRWGSFKRSPDLPPACPSPVRLRFGGMAPSSAHPTCLAHAPRLEDFGLAVGLLRASAHPTCLAHAPRLEDFGLAVGLLRASAHPTSLAHAPRLEES